MFSQLFIHLHPVQNRCLIFENLDASQKFPFPFDLQLLHLETEDKKYAGYKCTTLFVT